MFAYGKNVKSLTSYNLMRGVTDFSDLRQYDLFESGYSFLIVVDIPEFMKRLGEREQYRDIINSYTHMLENDFRGLDGIDNITSSSAEITNGTNTINLINKVEKPTAGTFSMRYYERSGGLINKFHELYLTGIKDPLAHQVKSYHGLIDRSNLNRGDNSDFVPGFDKEVFSFLYVVTDNTFRNVEKAYLIASAQLTNVDNSIYNGDRGDIQFKEVTCEFSGFPISNDVVTMKAQAILDAMVSEKNTSKTRVLLNSNVFPYREIGRIHEGENGDGSDVTSTATNNTVEGTTYDHGDASALYTHYNQLWKDAESVGAVGTAD